MMNRLFLFLVLLLVSAAAAAQKAPSEMTASELNQKRGEALAAKEDAVVAAYDAAIKLKKELDEAVKVEDFDKAATLQNQLKAVKIPVPATGRIRELQAELDKAVAAEDYSKADALKKEIAALKGGSSSAPIATSGSTAPANNAAAPKAGSPPAKTSSATVKKTAPKAGLVAAPDPVETAPVTSAPPPPAPLPAASSSMSAADIYGGSATYFGLDFSLFSFVSAKKAGEEQKHIKYVQAWQDQFSKKIPEKKLGGWLGKSQFNNERMTGEGSSMQNLNRQWIVMTNRGLTKEAIQAHLMTYRSSANGLGLVLMPGSLDETSGELSLYVVWFDLGTRAVIHMQDISVKAPPSSMTARWLNALVSATKKYVDQHYKKRA